MRRQLGRHQQVVLLEGGPVRAAQEDGRADHPAAAAQRREHGTHPAGHRPPLAQQFGQGVLGAGRLGEDRAHPAQHLGEGAARTHLAQLGREQRLRRERDLRGERLVALVLALPEVTQPVGAAQPEHQRPGRALVADQQRIAEVDEDRVGEGRHRRPAQPHHDLVRVDAAGDAPGGRADEPQPVAVAPGRARQLARHLPAVAEAGAASGRLLAGAAGRAGAGLRRRRAVLDRRVGLAPARAAGAAASAGALGRGGGVLCG